MISASGCLVLDTSSPASRHNDDTISLPEYSRGHMLVFYCIRGITTLGPWWPDPAADVKMAQLGPTLVSGWQDSPISTLLFGWYRTTTTYLHRHGCRRGS